VAPPAFDHLAQRFNRTLVFLLDYSGSMHGKALEDAKAALVNAIQTLSPSDHFGIIKFNHLHEWYKGPGSAQPAPSAPPQSGFIDHKMQEMTPPGGFTLLFQATEDAKLQAIQWVNSVTVAGATDIMTPLLGGPNREMGALQVLQDHQGRNQGNTVPYIFMLTDGAVNGEDEIVRQVKGFCDNPSTWPWAQKPRFMTCGIGQYTNAYFLKMLATFGKGFSEIALDPQRLYKQINSLMDRASFPVLTDVSLELPPDCLQAEIYPGANYMDPHQPWTTAIPDLFVGAPLIISGKFVNQSPQLMNFTLKGRLPSGEMHTMLVPFRASDEPLPVSKMMAKQRIDMLTSESWLCERTDLHRSNTLKQMAISESMNYSIVSPYTVMVAIETTPQKMEDYNKNKKDSGSSGSSKLFLGAAIGGAVVVGAGAAAYMAFGDPGAASGMASGLGVIGSGMVDGFVFMGEGLADVGIFLGEGIVAGGEAVGTVAVEGGEAAISCCEGCFCCAFIGDCCGNIGDCCGGIGDFCGDCCGNVGDCCGNIGDCCGNIGECLGPAAECLCEILSIFK